MIIPISATVDDEQIQAKKRLQVSWRFLIGKGIEHMDRCAPRDEILREQFGQAIKHRQYLRAIHYLREKHPKIWDAMVEEGIMEVV